MLLSKEDFLGMVDHSILRPETGVEAAVQEALLVAEAGVFSVCVKPNHVSAVSEALKDTDTLVGTVIGFPHGSHTVETKIVEALQATYDGASELDIVADFSKLLGSDEEIRQERDTIQEFCESVKFEGDLCVKVIIETAHFSEDQLKKVAEALAVTDVDFLKTSTGFAGAGATVENLRILSKFGFPKAVKASGGVRSAEDAQAFVEAGATRLGCSSSLAVAEQLRS